MTDYAGYLAAIGTSLFFSFGSTLFTLSGRMVGSPVVNRTRLLVAVICVALLHWATYGQPFPLDAGSERWFWMGLSGFVGLALGDAFLFQAFVMVGPRISMLLMALSPVLATLLAFVFLGERLAVQELLGIGLTVGGIAWVVTERSSRESKSVQVTHPREYLIGLLFGLGGAMGQAGGLMLSKVGLEGGFPALSGNIIRIIIAMIAVWAVAVVRGEVVQGFATLRRHPRAILMLSIGAITGPVIGVYLSLVAVQRIEVGIASTLTSLTPIFLLPISAVVFHERITRQAILGTVVAFVGTAILFL